MAAERQDTSLPFWTIDQAALHFGYKRATILKYIREGLPTYHEGLTVKPSELVLEVLQRRQRELKTRSQ